MGVGFTGAIRRRIFHELESKLLLIPLNNPYDTPSILPHITPFKELRL